MIFCHISAFVNIVSRNPLYPMIMTRLFLMVMSQWQLPKHTMFGHAMAFSHVAFGKIHSQLPIYHILNYKVIVLITIKTCIMDYQHLSLSLYAYFYNAWPIQNHPILYYYCLALYSQVSSLYIYYQINIPMNNTLSNQAQEPITNLCQIIYCLGLFKLFFLFHHPFQISIT